MGVFDEYNLNVVMAYSVTGLKAWIAAQSAELSQKGVEMMINWEKGQKSPVLLSSRASRSYSGASEHNEGTDDILALVACWHTAACRSC